MNNALVTAPTTEPVSFAELGAHLRLHTDTLAAEQSYLETLISAAREHVEQETRRALITQTWELSLDAHPRSPSDDDWWDGVREGPVTVSVADRVELPIAPLQSVESINSYSDDDTETLMDSGYHVDTRATPGRVVLSSGGVWPSFTRTHSGIVIQYKSGYGDAATDVPAPLRQAIMIVAADWYENRESRVIGTISASAGNSLEVILEKYRVHRL